jgi:hypothetical protein
MPINGQLSTAQEVRPHSPSPLQSDVIPSSLTPTSSFRKAIAEVAERLERPNGKRRKMLTVKPQNRVRKPREQTLTEPYVKATVHQNASISSVEKPHPQIGRGAPPAQTKDETNSNDLSRKTLKRLNAFRFEPPCIVATEKPCDEASTGQGDDSIGVQILEHVIQPEENSHDDHQVSISRQATDSAKLTEATLPLHTNNISEFSPNEHEHLLAGKPENSCPSPFELDDFDQRSLEDAFQTAEASLNAELLDNLDLDTLITTPETLHRQGSTDSDFGSDPFEPDDDGPENELYSFFSLLENSADAPASESTEDGFTEVQKNLESMLPPSYQTPRKSPPSSNTPTKSCTTQLITPESDYPLHQTTPQDPTPSPFLRPTFPTPVPAHSPISNLIPTTRILTCFRVAEYLRAISSSTCTTTSTPNLLVELYAVVTSSTRIGSTQHFTFADLFFSQRPPHLQGTCIWWQGSELYEDDTKVFLSASKERGRICRAIVRPKKQVQGAKGKAASAAVGSSPLAKRLTVKEGGSPRRGGGERGQAPLGVVEVEVLNIWEAGWEDVEYVRGIVAT